ncbi:MAG: bicyclomycin resistance protein [Burkholderiaceae bacterium]|jgi:ABC-type transport system substrate-binding protein|nr:bicyclomycin resistance protein [Burkholderiaceae bacterium]
MTSPDSPQRRKALKAVALASLGVPAGVLAQQPKDGIKELRYPFEVAETGFDPAQIVDLYSRIVTSHIFDGLWDYDHLARPFKVRPNTATAMPEISDDFRTYVVRLRPGIFFQDDPAFKGKRRELVADDYVYSFKRFFDPRWKSPAYASLSDLRFIGLSDLRERAVKDKTPFDYNSTVEGLRALDRYTLQFKFERPLPRVVLTLAGGDLYGAVAREVVEAYGDKVMENPVGTGPFRLLEWRRSSKIVLERNPSYRDVRYDAEPNADDAEGQALLARFRGRKLPMIDRVVISIIDEVQPRWLSFLNQQQDLLYLLPFDFVNLAAPNGKLAPSLARHGVRMWRTLASDVTLIYFNMHDPVVGGYEPENVALRRAIGLGINIDQEVRLYWRGQAIAAQSALVPNTVGYSSKFLSENGQYDPARAKALLDLFGYVDHDGDGWRERPDGSPLVLHWATTPDQRARQRDELRRKDLTALGIKVDFKAAKWPENLRNARAGKLQVWNLGGSAASPDGQESLDRAATVHWGGQNMARFSNKRFDNIYERLRSLPDGPEREALFEEAKRLMTAYAPYKFGIHRILTDLAWPWVEGFRRPVFWLDWWQYVDIDAAQQAKGIK